LKEKFENDDNKEEIENWFNMCPESYIQEFLRQRRNLNFRYSIFSKLEIELCNLEVNKIVNA